MEGAYDSEEAFERLMDDLQLVLGARAGRVLTQDDVDSLQRLEHHWRVNDERATAAYSRGWRDALQNSGGDALVEANARADENWAEAATQKALRKFDGVVISELTAVIRETVDFLASYFGPVASDDPQGWSDKDARDIHAMLVAKLPKNAESDSVGEHVGDAS